MRQTRWWKLPSLPASIRSRPTSRRNAHILARTPAVPAESGQKVMVETRWRQFFADPSQWWDHRAEKTNSRFPDFTHKRTKDALWLNGRQNPEWVEAELAAMPAGHAQQSIVYWNTLLGRHVKNREDARALELFRQMQEEGMGPDTFTYVQALKACGGLGALEDGRLIHEQVLQSGCEGDVFVGSCLIDMYAKCGSIEEARRVFDRMGTRDVVVWTVMLKGYLKAGQGQNALELSRLMQREGVRQDQITVVTVLNACASERELEEGRRVHEQVVENGLEANAFVSSGLVDMYAKCGSIDEAWRVFDGMLSRDVVAWNAMILGYAKCGQGQKAVELYQRMPLEGMRPDRVTYMGVLNACASVTDLDQTRRVHGQIIQSGDDSDVYVSSCLIDTYAKCGSIEDAWSVFSKMPARDVAVWNAMLLGYVKCGQGLRALNLFDQMQAEGLEPNHVTFMGVLNACASVAAVQKGRAVHAQIAKSPWELDVYVRNALIDMYAKCGDLKEAEKVFETTSMRDFVCWSTMLWAYTLHGRAKEAIVLFEQMYREGVGIDKTTFLGLLSACSHGGLVEEGVGYLNLMHSLSDIPATLDLYSCLIDLLGRAGRIHEAEEVILTMPFQADVAVWKALLGACRFHCNLLMGERIARRILQLDPHNGAGYLLLSNIYSAAGKWARSAAIQQLRAKRGVKKQIGCTWIVVDGQVHSFLVDDQKHPQIQQINAELERLLGEMKKCGYIPDTVSALHDVDEGEKLGRLTHHSEKLAIAYGLISTPAGTPVHIFKNSRVCEGCHTATKFITNVVGREIVVRVANRFHHFVVRTHIANNKHRCHHTCHTLHTNT